MSLKAFASATMIAGNIIHIYLLGALVILMSGLLHLSLSGSCLISHLLYLFLTRVEFFLCILFLLELFSHLFQSVTLANRLSINLVAGSLLTFLLSSSIGSLGLSLAVVSSLIVLFVLLLVFSFELFNCMIQLFIFMLLSLELSV
jgi:F0F1-type ATP synthase membrane subunit a